jgi:ATP-dependent Clp protease ATP-binding subunit ClpC
MNMQPGRVIKIVKRESHEEILKNPYLLVMLAITIAGAIFGLNRASHVFAPLFFLAALAGMGWLGWQQWNAEKAEAKALDYTQLAATDLSSFATWLKENVRGQDETVDSILAELQANLGLATSGRTLGAFFLVGPTGTGKTFLGQLIAEALYPESEPIILRMNQYKHGDDVFTLIGPPPGSPGYEVGGTLTRPVLENPRRVIIFDELEKAHRDLQHCLYDILDTASCREKSSGRTVDFSGCVFFATCNAGVEALRALRRDGQPDPVSWLGQSRDALVDAAGFDRAFLARWSAIYFMDELSPLHVAEVACLQLARHWRSYGIEVKHAAPELILDAVQRNEEFKQYGVRQLGAYVQMKTSAAIGQARARGVKKVDLIVGANGNLEISVAPE